MKNIDHSNEELKNEIWNYADEIRRIIKATIRRNYEKLRTLSSRLDTDDFESEALISVIEAFLSKGSVELNMIPRVVACQIIDIIRRESRRPSIACDLEDLDSIYGLEEAKAEKQSSTSISRIEGFSSHFDSPEDIAIVKDLVNLFEEGSRERTMFELYIEAFANIDEYNERNSFKDEKKNNVLTWIAHKMGFANSSSSAFNKTRNRMQAILANAGLAQMYPDAVSRLVSLGYEV